MAFEVKEWIDRQVQYPGRRKLTSTIIENVYDIERAEGTVSEPGNAFDADNMNDLEARIKSAFESIRDTDISVMDKNNHFTAEKLDGVLDELFMFAANGKKLIADAIGGTASPSDSFAQLASLIIQNKNNYYEGVVPSFALSGTNSSPDDSIVLNFSFGFVPKIVLLSNLYCSIDYGYGSLLNQISLSNVTYQVTQNGFKYGIKNIKKDSITLWVKSSTLYDYASIFLKDNARIENSGTSKIYAFG